MVIWNKMAGSLDSDLHALSGHLTTKKSITLIKNYEGNYVWSYSFLIIFRI